MEGAALAPGATPARQWVARGPHRRLPRLGPKPHLCHLDGAPLPLGELHGRCPLLVRHPLGLPHLPADHLLLELGLGPVHHSLRNQHRVQPAEGEGSC